MVLGIDFDGTCVYHKYPQIGEDAPLVTDVLTTLISHGHKLVLNTMRSGKELADAVQWFKDRNIELYGVNRTPGQNEWTSSPKVYAELYVDDAALGAPLLSGRVIDWAKVLVMISKMNERIFNYSGYENKRELREHRRDVEVHYCADALLVNKDNKLLVLKRSDGDWLFPGKFGFPGGHIDEGETALQAVIREVQEETAITLHDAMELTTYKFDKEFTSTFFIAYESQGHFSYSHIRLDPEEHSAYCWVSMDTFKKLGERKQLAGDIFTALYTVLCDAH